MLLILCRGSASAAARLVAVVGLALTLSMSRSEAEPLCHCAPGLCHCFTMCTCLDNGCCPKRVCNCNSPGNGKVIGGATQSRPTTKLPSIKPIAPPRGRLR